MLMVKVAFSLLMALRLEVVILAVRIVVALADDGEIREKRKR